jgi:general secretion pathway protein G
VDRAHACARKERGTQGLNSGRNRDSRTIGRRSRSAWRHSGFTLIELLVAVAIVGILSGIAIPSYSEFIYRAEVARAIAEVQALASEIDGFYLGTKHYPSSLADIGRAGTLDPWGQPYRYLNIADDHPSNGALRKDHNLVPVNSDYDLYSIGRDAQTATAFSSGPAKDDVVRANNGGFYGLAERY